MKNKEKYANEIVEVAIKNDMVSVDKQTGEILSCFGADCEKCLFFQPCSRPFTCRGMFSSWANAEYKEPRQFTEREIKFVELFPEIKYLARDKNGVLFAYTDKPQKDEDTWDYFCCNNPAATLKRITLWGLEFNTIQWDDEEPTSREEILGK